MTEAIVHFSDIHKVRTRLHTLIDLGLGYLTLGEQTPALSGGEAQRLKLTTEFRRNQTASVFILDEPSVGLHPLDIRTLLGVLQRLLDKGATVIVIEHDLDIVANADQIIATGDPHEIAAAAQSATGRYLAAHLTIRPGGVQV